MNLKKKIRNQNLRAFWITNSNIQNIEIAIKLKYFDIFVIDYEHSLISVEEARNIIIFLNHNSIPVFMRFARFNIISAPKFLDFGINGIIASDIRSLSELDKIKKIIFYQNLGNRGVGLGRMNDHGDKFIKYLNNSNKSLVFLPMIESKIKTSEIELIYKDKTVDGCMIGPYDLSMSLNQPGNFHSKNFKEIENFILKMKKKYKKGAGLHFMDKDIKQFKSFQKKGFNFMPILTDIQFFKIGINQLLKK